MHKRTFFWSAIDILATKGIQFLITIVLARLLAPSDFGIIAILLVLVSITQVFVEGGLTTVLIRKTEVKPIELSTVFTLNFVVAILFTIILFNSANLIAVFYDDVRLIPLIKILSFSVVINAISIVPRSILTLKMDFKSQSIVSIISAVISGLVAVYCAYRGLEYWALIIQYMLMVCTSSILLILISKWRLSFSFNIAIAKESYLFGYKLMVAGLIDTLFKNSYTLVIGKFYPPAQLGFFNQAERLSSLPITSLTQMVQRVNFQILVNNNGSDNKANFTKSFVMINNLTMFFFIPFSFLFLSISEPLVHLLLGDKWLSIIPILNFFIISNIFLPMGSVFLNVLKIIGRSDVYLKAEILKKLVLISSLLLTFKNGIDYILYGLLFTSVLSYLININLSKPFIDFDIHSFYKNLVIVFSVSVLSLFFVYLLSENFLLHKFFGSDFYWLLECLFRFVFFIVIYISLSYVFLKELLLLSYNVIKQKSSSLF